MVELGGSERIQHGPIWFRCNTYPSTKVYFYCVLPQNTELIPPRRDEFYIGTSKEQKETYIVRIHDSIPSYSESKNDLNFFDICFSCNKMQVLPKYILCFVLYILKQICKANKERSGKYAIVLRWSTPSSRQSNNHVRVITGPFPSYLLVPEKRNRNTRETRGFHWRPVEVATGPRGDPLPSEVPLERLIP